MLTLKGETFASRVASSLLKTLDLDELITTSIEEYETFANEYCINFKKLQKVKKKIQKNLINSKLFNSKLFTENLEKGYTAAYNKFINLSQKENIIL